MSSEGVKFIDTFKERYREEKKKREREIADDFYTRCDSKDFDIHSEVNTLLLKKEALRQENDVLDRVLRYFSGDTR